MNFLKRLILAPLMAAMQVHSGQERYSALVLAKVRKELVLKDGVVFNNDYEVIPKPARSRYPYAIPRSLFPTTIKPTV